MSFARVISKKNSALLTYTPAWQSLSDHFNHIKRVSMLEMFNNDPQRFDNFTLDDGQLFLDYSKNRINQQTMKRLIALARQVDLESWRDRMFAGDTINHTEGRAVLHTALRKPRCAQLHLGGVNICGQVHKELDKLEKFVKKVRNGQWLGYTGKKVKHIVNIGIGGSDLGPKMVSNALTPYAKKGIDIHFISTIDATQLSDCLSQINHEEVLFIIASKSFGTQETLMNAHSARQWFLAHDEVSKQDVASHFVAVSTNIEAVEAFGIDSENMFEFWDWVGGRYSLWSAIGLPIMLHVGMDNFRELLAGAHAMDNHFQNKPLEENMPVILALLGIWYNNFFSADSHAILPYDHYLNLLPNYLQQADMESNGKSVDRNGKNVNYSTGGIIWGTEGINGQHAYYQLIHQGTNIVPADFIISLKPSNDLDNHLGRHSDVVFANFIAQTEALMRGRTRQQTRSRLEAENKSEEFIQRNLATMTFTGNQPSNSIIMDDLSPFSLGQLLAMYEHKIFSQGVIWNLNSFDQWGVELGKQLAKRIQKELEVGRPLSSHDSSTVGLINYIMNAKQ